MALKETRHQFRADLTELGRQTLGGLDLVTQQLDRALEAISYQGRRAGHDGRGRR
jgi:hypothetical protein